MKILNFGSCNIDIVYAVDHIVHVGETQTTDHMEVFPGGKGLNQSIALARAGAEVYHAGCIGEDGDMLLETLQDSGVDVSYVKRVPQKNGHAIIQVSKAGENSIFLYPGSNHTVDRNYIDEVLADFGPGDLLLLQNEINNIGYLVDRAYEKGMCIVLNPSPYDERLNRLDFHKLSYVVLNEVEARQIAGRTDPEACIGFLKSAYPELKIMLTLGEKGCVYADRDQTLRQSAFRVEAVDTTAAGDTFTGYFVAGIATAEPCAQNLKLASAAAALAVMSKGAAPSIPERARAIDILGKLKPQKEDGKGRTKEIIEAYLEENIRDASLQRLSVLLGYSTVYTVGVVKQVMGMSFSKLLQEKRCEKAAHLLLHTQLSVRQIIGAVGYENESFFRKLFRQKYRKSPYQFRKEHGV